MMHKKAPAGFPVEALAKPFWSGVAAGWPALQPSRALAAVLSTASLLL